MATIKTGWLKAIVDGVSTRVYAISHAKCCYYGDPANGVTVQDNIDEINRNLGGFSLVECTESEYDALTTKSPTTIYLIKADEV